MISRFPSFIWPLAVAALLAVTGCAGSKHSSASMDSSASAEPDKNQKLEDAKHSAEDAEQKAHQLREEKNRNTAKSGN